MHSICRYSCGWAYQLAHIHTHIHISIYTTTIISSVHRFQHTSKAHVFSLISHSLSSLSLSLLCVNFHPYLNAPNCMLNNWSGIDFNLHWLRFALLLRSVDCYRCIVLVVVVAIINAVIKFGFAVRCSWQYHHLNDKHIKIISFWCEWCV